MNISRTPRRNLLCLSLLPCLMAAPTAQAADAGEALKQAWNCASGTVAAAGTVATDLYEKGQALASLGPTAGKCLATSGSDQAGFALTMGALTAIKLASPDSLPTGQCLPRIQQQLARPFGAGLAAVLPPGSASNQLKQLVASDVAAGELWSKLEALPPPVMTLASHVECGCEFIDQGLSLADMSAVGDAIEQVSESCAGFLDAAGLGFINDFGGSAISLAGDVYGAAGEAWDDLQKIPEAAPDAAVYFGYWGAQVPNMARYHALNPEANLGLGKWQAGSGTWVVGPGYQGNYMIDMPLMTSQCIDYYQRHRFSDDHAHSQCAEYRDRASAEATAMGGQFRAIVKVRDLLGSRLQQEVDTHWVWRLPYQSAVSPYAQGDNHWSTADAISHVYAQVIGSAPKNQAGLEDWQYPASGAYASAREILPNVGFDADKAADLAIAGLAAGLEQATRQRWQQHGSQARDYWLQKWFPAAPLQGAYGCPTDAVLGPACRQQVVETFDKVCQAAVVSAHVDTPNVLVAAGRLAKARQNCHSWIDPQLARAQDLASPGPNVATTLATVCGGLAPRSEQEVRCRGLVADTYADCTLEALKQQKNEASAEACLTTAVPGMRSRLTLGRHVPAQPAPGTIKAPPPGHYQPGTITPAPAGTTNTAPRSSTGIRIGGGTNTGSRPTAPAPTLRVAPALRPAPATTPPECPAGQVLATARDGTKSCVASE